MRPSVRGAACLPVLLLWFVGCAGTGAKSRPDWVTGPPAAYPSEAWVTASASGSSVDSARSSARAALSRVFLSRVESEVRDRQESTVQSGDAGSRSSVVEKLEVDTTVSSEGSFEGVRVAEVWQEPHGQLWHALAVVDKAALRKALAVEIAEAARRVGSDLARADAAATPLGEARALLDGVRSSAERDVLVARARVAGAAADGFRPTTAEIERRLDEVLWSTRFRVRAVEVDASGESRGDLPELREALEKRINDIGFRVVAADEPGSLMLSSRMVLEEVPRGFEGHFVRWEGGWQLGAPGSDGTVLLSSQGSGGESYSTLSVARARALAKGAQKLAADLQKQISRYLQEREDH
jgi:hypothetical protein